MYLHPSFRVAVIQDIESSKVKIHFVLVPVTLVHFYIVSVKVIFPAFFLAYTVILRVSDILVLSLSGKFES